MSSAAPTIGIDFGTSNSKMAWYNPKIKEAQIIMNAEGETETPSVVYFGKQEVLVGSPAVEMLEYENERKRVIISVKRELVTTPVIALPGKSVKAVEVAAEILRKLKRDAEELHFRQEVTHAVITYPASFDTPERDRIREAARLAGFAEVQMLEEPVAAAIAYAQMGLEVGKFVLVYDLGGGTFDLAVLVREDDGLFRPALEPQGIKRCGGDDFDEALYNHCETIAKGKLGRSISPTGKRDLHFLNQCRQRKENLSNAERRLFKSYLKPGAVLFQYEIDRTTFESLISAKVEETVRKTKAILEQAEAQGQTVDTMVLIGGSSRVPLVQRLLAKNLSVKPQPWQYRDVAVALGAAYEGNRLWGVENQYRSAVEAAWADKKLEKTKIADLLARANKLYLSQESVAKIEREIMGDVKEAIFERQSKPVKPQPISPTKQRIQQSPRKPKAVKAEAVSPSKQRIQQSPRKPEDFTLAHTILGHPNRVNSVAISPDGQTLASGGGETAIKLWDLRTKELLHILEGHSNLVLCVAFSPNGQTLASGSYDATIRLWNPLNGKSLHTCTGHSDTVFSVAISPDGQILASGCDDQTIKVWNLRTGALLRTLTGHSDTVFSVAISPDGQTLASGSADKTIKLWNPRTGALLRTFTGHSDAVFFVIFSPDGRTLASGSADTNIKVRDLRTGGLLRTLEGHSSWVNSLAINPDGRTLASGSADHSIKLWDLRTGGLLRTFSEHSDWVRSVAFSPDGQTLASGSADQTIKIWGMATTVDALADRPDLSEDQITDLEREVIGDGKEAISERQSKLVKSQPKRQSKLVKPGVTSKPEPTESKPVTKPEPAGSKPASRLKLVGSKPTSKPEDFTLAFTLTGHSNWVRSVAISPDGQTLASGSHDATIKLWDLRTETLLRTLTGLSSLVLSVAFSPDGQTLASGTYGQAIELWNLHTGKLPLTLKEHSKEVVSVAISPDGQTLASGSLDKTIKLWNVRTGKLLRTLTGGWFRKSEIRSVAFSPDGQILASGGDDSKVKLWNPHTGDLLRTLEGHSGWVNSIAISRDGQFLASGSEDRAIKIWNLRTGTLLRTLEGHSNRVYSTAFSPDGQTLASGSADHTIKLWDLQTGKLKHTFSEHSDWVRSVTISPDGQTLASGSDDKTIKIWRKTTTV